MNDIECLGVLTALIETNDKLILAESYNSGTVDKFPSVIELMLCFGILWSFHFEMNFFVHIIGTPITMMLRQIKARIQSFLKLF